MGLKNSKNSLNFLLKETANQLNCVDYNKKVRLIAMNIFKIIKKRQRNADRIRVVENIGKRPALAFTEQSDFQLIIFFNKKEPPFEDILLELETILLENEHDEDPFTKNHDQVQIRNLSIDTNCTSISFIVEGIKFDLFAAPNYKSHSFLADSEQIEKALEKLRNQENPFRDFSILSPALAEGYINFVQSQSPFAQTIGKLAKYWNNNIFIGKWITGRSQLIEIIAFKSVEEKAGSKDLATVFTHFIEQIANYDQLRIFNQKNYNFPIPEEILEQTPIVLDPINPYNNLALIPEDAAGKLIDSARITLEKLDQFKNPPNEWNSTFLNLHDFQNWIFTFLQN